MEFYGLFGKSLSHSLSPVIHQKIYSEIGLEAGYKSFEFPLSELKNAIHALRLLSFGGVNITIPYKEEVIPYLDDLSPHAKTLQAVNTIKNDNGKLIGYNSDYDGIMLLFNRRNWSVAGEKVTVLGTGGAAKTAIAYLKDQNAKEIYVVSRSPERFENKGNVTYINYDSLHHVSGKFLINTTPVGMYPKVNETPVEESIIQSFDTLVDLIYNPEETLFLSLGKKNGIKGTNGLDMLIGQAIRAIEIWQDFSIDLDSKEDLMNEMAKIGDEQK